MTTTSESKDHLQASDEKTASQVFAKMIGYLSKKS